MAAETMKRLADNLAEALGWLRDSFSRLSFRHDTAPIATVERLFEFASTRAALIAQKKLYGYLKERMGTRYPKMFEDDVFVRSINIAKMHVFAATLSDMSVHVVAKTAAGASMEADACVDMARACYRSGIADNAAQAPDDAAVAGWHADFEARLDGTLWQNAAIGGSAFTESPKALIRWAPIAEELKRHDREIVENSIRFAFNEVIQDLARRLDAPAVAADWQASRAA